MKRWVVVGAAVGALSPVLISMLAGFHIALPTWLLLSLFPFSIGLLGNEGLPTVMQWSRYGVCLLLNAALFAGLGVCFGLLMRAANRRKPQ